MVAILSNQREVIFEAVQAMYTDVASHPEKVFHFPTGRDACRFVGYPDEQLDLIPPTAVESFAGVGYPFAAGAVQPGNTVLDVGSGSGTDVLIARTWAGPSGKVIGLDMTEAMLEKLARNVSLAGATNVEWVQGNAEEIPLPDASVDVVTSNGVLNLVPDKARAVAEIFRVLRPGGRVQIADIVLGRPIDTACSADPQLWAECIVGATPEDSYLAFFHAAGFAEIETLAKLDYFSASASPETRSIATSFRACSLVLRARKPAPDGDASVLPPWRDTHSSHAAASLNPSSAADAPAPLPRADAVFDAQGQICGALEPVLKARMRDLASGQVLEVLTNDPSARLGLPSWCRLTGHGLLATVEEDAIRTRFYLRKKKR